ncbi:hypothetical protein [Anoxybacillus ayderensis]|uniref:hypothetical protein n=1 Tax=Anoxybacillus ayderensis TaxID=265546 RepID=UPI002E2346DA|nr:hypothetical protein [Anoxybacillus ayderensis]
MDENKTKWKDKLFYFLEKKFIVCIITTLISITLLLKILTLFEIESLSGYILKIDTFISEKLSNAFINRDSTLITIAAVFIGIYFTIFTLMATISTKSAFSIFEKKHFNDLLTYIRNAFLASFSYLFISLVLPLISRLGWLYSIICLILLTYMLLSALRFGLLIYLILRRDINSYLNKVENDKLEERRYKRIMYELEKFLEEKANEKSVDKAKDISKFLEERKKKQQ